MKTITEIYSPKVNELSYGDFIYHAEFGLCVVARVSSDAACIIELWDGNRYVEPVKVYGNSSVTKEELLAMLGGELYLLDEFVYVSKGDAHKYITLRPIEPKDRT